MLLWLLSGLAFSLANQCPPDTKYNENNNLCYYFSSSPDAFKYAQVECSLKGGVLAKIRNGFENAFVAELGNSVFANSSDFWIGGWCRDDVEECYSNWKWMDWTRFTYTKWAPGQPIHYDTAKFCVSMQTNGGQWMNADCKNDLKPYVCELPPAAGPCMAKCDEGWEFLQETNFCYRYNGVLTFDNAEANCRQYQGHLASVHSFFEFHFVYGLAGGVASRPRPTYIPQWSSVHYVNGVWANTDGTPVDYGWNTTITPPDLDHVTVIYKDGVWTIDMLEDAPTDTNRFVCKKTPNY